MATKCYSAEEPEAQILVTRCTKWCENAVVTARTVASGSGSNWTELPVSLH